LSTLATIRCRVALLVLIGAVAGCYSPSIKNGTLACAEAGKPCPDGFVCHSSDGLCYSSQGNDGPMDGGDAPKVDVPDAAELDVHDAGSADVRDAPQVDVGEAGTETAPGRDSGSDAPTGNGGLGSACTAGAQCASGVCADGVCCQNACSGRCEACNLPSALGVCTAVAAGAPSPTGHVPCATDPVASCDQDGTCDGNRGCRLMLAGTACGPSSCSAGMGTPAATCDGQGQCRSGTARACAPYTCNTTTACFTACTSNTQCQLPNTCSNGSCGPKANGSSCSQSSECASQNCVDGVCCNEACTALCKACDVAASLGTCVQVTMGQPHGVRPACAGAGTTCGGACSSASPTACTFPGDAVTCRAASCSVATLTARAGCNGAGSCAAPTTSSCGNFTCNPGGTGCLTACTSDSHCATTARPYCDAGACVSGRPNGARCQAALECASNRCVDGYCCNDACGSSCQACDVAGHLGTCWPVASGTPYGGRPPCGGMGPCAGSCNNQPSGQCFFPGSTTPCTCPIGAGSCDGMGDCRNLGNICL
jgi:hypothetical protein